MRDEHRFTSTSQMSWFIFVVAVVSGVILFSVPSQGITIQRDDPAIYYHGRWDSSFGSWWYVRFVLSVVQKIDLLTRPGPVQGSSSMSAI